MLMLTTLENGLAPMPLKAETRYQYLVERFTEESDVLVVFAGRVVVVRLLVNVESVARWTVKPDSFVEASVQMRLTRWLFGVPVRDAVSLVGAFGTSSGVVTDAGPA